MAESIVRGKVGLPPNDGIAEMCRGGSGRAYLFSADNLMVRFEWRAAGQAKRRAARTGVNEGVMVPDTEMEESRWPGYRGFRRRWSARGGPVFGLMP